LPKPATANAPVASNTPSTNHRTCQMLARGVSSVEINLSVFGKTKIRKTKSPFE
jgi:hypothetical protein